jgi:hypothetical protein
VPWPVYSEQLFSRANSTAWAYVTVPAGHRYVVTSVTVKGLAGSVTGAQVALAGLVLMWLPIQATEYGRVTNLRSVVYAGQQLGAVMSALDMGIGIAGYAFGPPTATAREVPEPVEGPPPEGWTGFGDMARDVSPGGRGRSDSVQRGVRRWGLVGRDVDEGRQVDPVRAVLRSQSS